MSALLKAETVHRTEISPLLFVSDARIEAFSEVFPQMSDLRRVPQDSVAQLVGEDGLLILELAEPGALPLLENIARTALNTKLLVISDALPTAAVRAMLSLEASDIAATQASPIDIARASERLLGTSSSDPLRKNNCWAVTGAVGGAGATTLAIELACATAMRDPENSVCLVDLNLADGMTAAYLEGKPQLDIPGLMAAPERLDPTLLSAYIWSHEIGVDLISAPRDPDIHDTVNADMVLRLLDTVCAVYSHVVVDLPRHRAPWSKPLLSAVDEVMVVSEFTVPSLHAAADMAREIDALRMDRGGAKLILNRMSDGRREFSVERAGKAIERDITSVIRSDWKAAREAVNLGMPIARVKPKSPLVKDAKALLQTLDPAPTEAGRKRLWG